MASKTAPCAFRMNSFATRFWTSLAIWHCWGSRFWEKWWQIVPDTPCTRPWSRASCATRRCGKRSLFRRTKVIQLIRSQRKRRPGTHCKDLVRRFTCRFTGLGRFHFHGPLFEKLLEFGSGLIHHCRCELAYGFLLFF